MDRVSLLALFLGACLGSAHAEASPPLVRVQTISLGAVNGRLDHICVDPQNNRLFVAALANQSLEVIDLTLGRHIRSISGIKGPQGVCFLPESHEVFVTSSQDGVLRVYDEGLHLVRFLNALENADNIRHDSLSNRIYLGYGKALAFIDPNGPSVLATLPLAGRPESFQAEKEGNRIFLNVPESQEVVVIDKASSQATAHWPLLEARENFPMALDERNHRLFIGCRKPAKVLIYDTNYGSYVGKVDCVGEADDMYWDSKSRRLYVTGGQGYLTVIGEVDPYLYKALATLPTADDARTSCFEPSSGTLYVAVPHHRKQPAEVWVYKTHP